MTEMVFGTVPVRAGEPILPRWWRTIDKWALSSVLMLFALGMLLGLAASVPLAEKNGLEPFYYVKRQAFFGGVALGVMMLVQREPDLTHVVLTTIAAGGFAGRLDGRQQQRDKHPDDGDHDQEFDQRESPTSVCASAPPDRRLATSDVAVGQKRLGVAAGRPRSDLGRHKRTHPTNKGRPNKGRPNKGRLETTQRSARHVSVAANATIVQLRRWSVCRLGVTSG